MKTRLLSSLVLLPLIVLAVASPAAAQKPIPNIKQTSQFRSLKTFVGTMFTKRAVPTTTTAKTAYKLKLSTKRTAANQKAKALYSQRVLRISKQDDNKQRRQIKKIRQNQKAQVLTLKGNLASRLAQLQGKENTAIARISNNYAVRIDPLITKRGKLQKKLDKAKTPAKRAALTTKINQVQKQINVLVNAKQADLNVIETKYDGRQSNLTDLFTAKIQRVKNAATRQIKQAKNAYKQLFKEKLANAKDKQTNEIQLITNVRDRGAGYIDQMPII